MSHNKPKAEGSVWEQDLLQFLCISWATEGTRFVFVHHTAHGGPSSRSVFLSPTEIRILKSEKEENLGRPHSFHRPCSPFPGVVKVSPGLVYPGGFLLCVHFSELQFNTEDLYSQALKESLPSLAHLDDANIMRGGDTIVRCQLQPKTCVLQNNVSTYS